MRVQFPISRIFIPYWRLHFLFVDNKKLQIPSSFKNMISNSHDLIFSRAMNKSLAA